MPNGRRGQTPPLPAELTEVRSYLAGFRAGRTTAVALEAAIDEVIHALAGGRYLTNVSDRRAMYAILVRARRANP